MSKLLIAFRYDCGKSASKRKKFVKTVIQKWTKSKYYHVEVCFQGKWLVASPHEKYLFTKPYEDRFYPGWDYYEVKVPRLSKTHIKFIENFIEDVEGSEYDWKGIFLCQAVRLGVQDVKKWFCSEISAKILQLCLVKSIQSYCPAQFSPGSLYDFIKSDLKKLN